MRAGFLVLLGLKVSTSVIFNCLENIANVIICL